MSQYLSIISDFVLSTGGAFLVCGSILLWALICGVIFGKRISPVVKILSEMVDQITPIEGELGFVEKFREFEKWVVSSDLLRFPWEEFSETLIFPTNSGKPIRNTHPADAFFNEATLLYPRLNVRFYNNLPNILTGLGILGTFVGLVFGIWEASKGIQGVVSSGTSLDDAMVKLLSGAALAFSTSISGLGASMVFSWFEKHKLNTALGLIRECSSSLDERLERITPEIIIVDMLEEVKIQSQELKMFNTEFAFNVAEALDKKMSDRLVPALDQLVEVVEGLRQDRADTNQEMITDIVTEFTTSLKGAAGEEMKNMAITLESLNSKMTDQVEAMTHSQTEIQEATQKTVGVMSDAVTSSLEELNNTVGKIEKSAQAMDDTAESFLNVTNQLQVNFNLLETVSRRLENVSLGLEETSESIEKSSSLNSEAIVTIKDGVEQLRTSQESLVTTWEDYKDRFENIDDNVSEFFKGMQSGVQAYTEQVHAFMKEMDSAMAKVTQDLGSAASETRETVEELADVMDKFLQDMKRDQRQL